MNIFINRIDTHAYIFCIFIIFNISLSRIQSLTEEWRLNMDLLYRNSYYVNERQQYLLILSFLHKIYTKYNKTDEKIYVICHSVCLPDRISIHVRCEIEWRVCVCVCYVDRTSSHERSAIETNGPQWFSLRLSWCCAREWSNTIKIVRYVRGIHGAI